MVKLEDKFLIDANTLMTASRQYYAYDILPSFWEIFGDEIKRGTIVLLDMVKAEIDKGQDKLKEWVSERTDDFEICNHIDPEIISKYAQIMQYIQECGFYNAQYHLKIPYKAHKYRLCRDLPFCSNSGIS